ncbi:polysaccharide biosynthesis/export family protein [Nitrospinota bacterium]
MHTAKQMDEKLHVAIIQKPTPAKTLPFQQKKISRRKTAGKPREKTPQFIIPEIAGIPEKNYTVGGKDVLAIIIFEEPELSRDEIRVSNDGYITVPLIGRVRVGGLAVEEIEQELARRLGKDFLVNPQVTVHIKEFVSKIVSVLGAVKKPGAIPLKGRTTLLETVARAGGVNIDTAGKKIIVLRHRPGKGKDVNHITVDLNRLLREGDLSLNMTLQDKDTVFIPKADQIFVFGEVKNPGPYELREQVVSVVEAISMAGGLTRLAAANRTRIVRVEGDQERAIPVNIEKIMEGDRSKDVILQAGDIVVIPEAYF